MSTLRISNIEAKSVPASATIDEKVKITNSSGDVLVFLDGKTSGITTVGINTTDGNITFDANSNVVVTGIITATKFVGTIEPTNLTVGGDLTITDKIIHSGDTNTAIRFPSADTISAETDSTERLRISSNGLVNIGAGSSASGLSPILHLHKNASSTAYLHITNNNTGITNNDGFLLGINGVGDCLVFNKDSTPIRFATQGIERLRIDSSGYVGAKRSTPLANLHTTNNELAIGANPTGAAAPNATYDGLVVDGEDASILNIRSSADGNLSYGRVAFSDDIRSRGYIDYRHRDGAGGALEFMNFAVAGSERLRITSDGDMGLGTGGNTISQRLDVRESSTTVFNASSNLPTIARLYNTAAVNGASAGLQLRTDNNNGSASIQYIHAVNSSTNYSSDLVFSRRLATSGSYAEACRITNAGNIKFPSGKGIDFSATGDSAGNQGSSELFDDYEEGSWTPAFRAGNNSTACPTTVNHAKYTRVGRLVVATAYFTMNSYASGTTGGDTRIVGLPYQNIGEHGGVTINYWWSLKQNINFMAGTVQGNSSEILIRATTSADVGTPNIDFDNTFGPSDSLILTATYYTS